MFYFKKKIDKIKKKKDTKEKRKKNERKTKKMNENSLKNLRNGKQGRPKGSRNKYNDLKTEFIEAFKTLGGRKFLLEVAKTKRGKRELAKMLAHMLPREINQNVQGDLKINIVQFSNIKKEEKK